MIIRLHLAGETIIIADGTEEKKPEKNRNQQVVCGEGGSCHSLLLLNKVNGKSKGNSIKRNKWQTHQSISNHQMAENVQPERSQYLAGHRYISSTESYLQIAMARFTRRSTA